MAATLAETMLGRSCAVRDRFVKAAFASDIGEAAKRMEKSVNEMKAAVSEGFEDSVTAAERFIKQGRHVVEDKVRDVSYQVKRKPMQALAVTFAAGLVLGLLVPRFGKK